MIKAEKPFNLAMRFGRYIKAFRVQMKNEPEVNEKKYDLLKITHDDTHVKITHALETDEIELLNERGEAI